MRPYQRVFGIIVAALALGGCVSTSEYEKLQVDNAALKQQLAAAERDKAALAESGKHAQEQHIALVRHLSQEVRMGQLQVRQYKHMLSVDLAEQIFFDSG